MSKERLIIFDTTMRDGEQSPGASMTRDEKLRIARALERMRVDVIEAGFPASSTGDFEAVRAAFAAAEEQRIEIAAPAAFAARYMLSGADRAAVLRVLRPPLLEYLASQPEPLLVESAGGWLAVFRSHYVEPRALPDFLAEARTLAGWLLR